MFDQILLILIAVLPGLAISYYIYLQDRYDREPKLILIVCFILGMLITYPAIKIEAWLESFNGANANHLGVLLFTSFIVVGLVEELVKFASLYLWPYRHKAFNEPLDGIVYAVMIGMGFATLENILYANQYNVKTILFRALTAVPAHGVFAVIMGYYAGLAKFDKANRVTLIAKSFLYPIFLHGLYDFFILQNYYEWLMVFATITLFVGIYIAILMIRTHLESSRIQSMKKEEEVEEEEEKILASIAPEVLEENEIMDAVIKDMKEEEE